MTAEALSKEVIFQFSDKQNTKFIEMASKLSEKKLQVHIFFSYDSFILKIAIQYF